MQLAVDGNKQLTPLATKAPGYTGLSGQLDGCCLSDFSWLAGAHMPSIVEVDH